MRAQHCSRAHHRRRVTLTEAAAVATLCGARFAQGAIVTSSASPATGFRVPARDGALSVLGPAPAPNDVLSNRNTHGCVCWYFLAGSYRLCAGTKYVIGRACARITGRAVCAVAHPRHDL